MSADATEALAAETTDVSPADTIHVLPAGKFGQETQHLRIIVEVLDLHLACLVLGFFDEWTVRVEGAHTISHVFAVFQDPGRNLVF